MTFNKWLDTLVEEKELDTDTEFIAEGLQGMNFIPFGCVIEAIKNTSKTEQAQIKTTLVKIDFCNGDIMHFFNHLAQALAI